MRGGAPSAGPWSSESTASTICVALVDSIGSPQRSRTVPSFFVLVGAQHRGRPHRAKSSRR